MKQNEQRRIRTKDETNIEKRMNVQNTIEKGKNEQQEERRIRMGDETKLGASLNVQKYN